MFSLAIVSYEEIMKTANFCVINLDIIAKLCGEKLWEICQKCRSDAGGR